GRYVGCAHEPIDGREVDDAAATPAPHVCDHVLGAEEHPFYVDRLHTVPLGLGDLVGRLVDTRYAGVVDQHVDAAVMLGHAIDRVANRTFIGDVDMPV